MKQLAFFNHYAYAFNSSTFFGFRTELAQLDVLSGIFANSFQFVLTKVCMQNSILTHLSLTAFVTSFNICSFVNADISSPCQSFKRD